MNRVKFRQWLKKNNLKHENNFGEHLKDLADEYKNITNTSLETIWHQLGVSRRLVHNWIMRPTSIHRFLKQKRELIEKTALLFNLTETEVSLVAKKAGIFILDNIDEELLKEKFSTGFNKKLKSWGGKNRYLYETFGINGKTFDRLKAGIHISRMTLLGILILMELDLEEIVQLLNLAGYQLSEALPVDLVLIHSFKYHTPIFNGIQRLNYINALLDEFELPLIQSRINDT